MINIIESDPQIKCSVSRGVPSESRALIWDVFFASRQRGFDLLTHFPWINDTTGTYCLTLSGKNNVCLATLVLRARTSHLVPTFAMIGMVCVDQTWRGRGLSNQLILNALTFSAEEKINSLLLWTTQPKLYGRHGFKGDAKHSETFGAVELSSCNPRTLVEFTARDYSNVFGLPPFGKKLVKFESPAAEIIAIETGEGLTLAEWKGPFSAVMNLIEAALPKTWSLNAPEGSRILCEITERGHSYTPLPTAKRMVRHLGKSINIPYISILERI
jgi:hypothetical protein